jgi:glutaredoxin
VRPAGKHLFSSPLISISGNEAFVIKVVVYTKDGCHLCENVIEELRKLSAIHPLKIASVDIMANEDLFQRYKEMIPVVEIDGRVRLGGTTLANRLTLSTVLQNALRQANRETEK